MSVIPAALAVLILAAVAGCDRGKPAAGGDAPSEWPPCEAVATPIVTAGATMYGSTEKIGGAADRIRDLGGGRFADYFAGMVVREECERLFVYRHPSAEFDRAIAADPSAGAITVLDAAYSIKELQVWMDRLAADPALTRDLTINAYGPHFDGSCVMVGASDVAKARDGLTRRFPDLPLCVREQGPVVYLDTT